MNTEEIVSRTQLLELFMEDKIIDTRYGWIYDGWIVEIVALHEIEPKYLENLTNAKFYKIKQIKPNKKIYKLED